MSIFILSDYFNVVGELINLFDGRALPRVMIVGDLMLDTYQSGTVERVSPEAPVPVLKLDSVTHVAGGAANVALNLATLGVDVALLGFAGDDQAADTLQDLVIKSGVTPHFVRKNNHPTTQKQRFMSGQHQLMRCDIERSWFDANHDSLIQKFEHLIANFDLCVLSDYNKGTLIDPQPYIQAAKKNGVPVLVDPKGRDFSRYAGATRVKPNLHEFNAAFECAHSDRDSSIQRYLTRNHVDFLLLTRGGDGMTLFSQKAAPVSISCEQYEVKDVTGAGDTVIAMLALALGLGFSIADAVKFANKAAGLVVQKAKTSALSRWEVRQLFLRSDRDPHHCVFTQQEVVDLGEELNSQGKRLVMTNGCFDLLHPGHVGYLREARECGDFLLVAVNSDESVKRLKGPHRPVQPEQDRCAVLESLECVDAVVTFSEDTPLELINLIKPRVLVKGVDYDDLTKVVGAKEVLSWGGEVKLLGPNKQWSSTTLLAKSEAKESIA